MTRGNSSRASSTPQKRKRQESPQSEDEIALRDDQPTPTPARHRNVRTYSNRIRRSLATDEVNDENEVDPLALEEEEPSPSKLVNGKHDAPRDTTETPAYEGEMPSAEDVMDDIQQVSQTPVKKRGRGRPKGSKNAITPVKSNLIASSQFDTPNKVATPAILRHVDRSARRRSARAIIQQTIDDELDGTDDEELAQHIYDTEDEIQESAEDAVLEDEVDSNLVAPEAPETPSKIPKRGRGRPKGSGKKKISEARKRSPTPPTNLAPHELYFAQNKSTSWKTSNNTLASLSLLTHDEYFELSRAYIDPHEQDISFLQQLHSRSFSQWGFELDQNFSILLYGYGSKRNLINSFATYLHGLPTFNASTHKIVVCNGYLSNTSIRDLSTTIAQALSPHPVKLGSQPTEILTSLFALLSEQSTMKITLMVNGIDSSALRRSAFQNFLASLSEHKRVHLIATADHPNFTLLWDSSLRSMYNFLFHDCTTFKPYTAEIDVVDEVHSLLGRSGRRVGGKEGVAFVLKSLSTRSRELFGVLVNEQLNGMSEGLEAVELADDFDADELQKSPQKRKSRSQDVGVEYNVLRQKVLDDFICPDEMMLRTMLKEFYDHQMITSKKDAMGVETLSVPFGKEELEAILEDLVL